MTHVISVSPSPCSSSSSASSLGTPYPIAHYESYDKFSAQYKCFLGVITAGYEPTSYTEAFQNVQWREAMHAKIWALNDNSTWTVETLPPRKRAIGSTWMYKIKYNADGSIE